MILLLITGCGDNASQQNDAQKSVSLSGQLPIGTTKITLCNEDAMCQEIITENGTYSFSNIEAKPGEKLQLEVLQKGHALYTSSFELHQGHNLYNIDSLASFQHLEISVDHSQAEYIYIGIIADHQAYIDTTMHVDSIYTYVIDSSTISSDVTTLKVDIAVQEGENVVNDNKLLASTQIYVKVYDQKSNPLVLQRPVSAPNRVSSLIGECNSFNYFYLDQGEDALLQDANGVYIDADENEAGIQVTLYGYNGETHKWQEVGNGDYTPDNGELKVCAGYEQSTIRIALPLLFEKPKTVCVQTQYSDALSKVSPAQNVLLEAKGSLFASAVTDENGRAVLELFRDVDQYQFSYTDLVTNQKDISFTPIADGTCDYAATITIENSFNATVGVTVKDEQGKAYANEYVWFYDEAHQSYQSALTDTAGKVLFKAIQGQSYKISSSSDTQNVLVVNTQTSVELTHRNLAPRLFMYTSDNQTQYHVIGFDADSNDLNLNVTIDSIAQEPDSKLTKGKTAHWIFSVPLDAQSANVSLSDELSSTSAPYYFQIPELNDVELLLTLKDPNADQVFSNTLYADINYSIDVLNCSYEIDNLRLFIDGAELADEKMVLKDLEGHMLKAQALFWFGVYEKEWNLQAKQTYRAPNITKPLIDKYVNIGLSEQFEVNVVDPQSEPLKYKWMVDGQFVDSIPLLSYTFDTLGEHNVSLEISNRYKNTTTNAQLISQYAKPVIVKDINGSDLNILMGSNAVIEHFEIEATDPYGTTLDYKWYINGALVSTQKRFDYTFDKLGDYSVHCVISNQYLSVASTVKKVHFFYDKPIIESTNLYSWTNVILKRENVFYVKAKDPYGEILTYEWFLDGQKVSDTDSLTFVPQDMYTHHITFKVSNKFNNSVISSLGIVTALRPIVNSPTSYTRIPAIINETKELSADATDPYGGELTYRWFSDRDGYIGNGKTISHTFSNTDWNYVFCRISNAYTSTIAFVFVDVNYKSPLITKELLGLDNTIRGLEYKFDVNASDPYNTSLSYAWSVNDTLIKSDSNNSFFGLLTNDGPNEVKVVVTNEYGETALSSTEVNATTPTPSFIEVFGNRTVKTGVMEHFEVLVEDVYNEPIYTWKIDGKTVGTDSVLNYAFTQPVDYNLSCEVSNKYGKKVVHSAIVSSSYLAPVVNDTNVVTKTVHQGEVQTFYVDVQNPEADALHYQWYVNDLLQENNTSSFSYAFEKNTPETVRYVVLNAFQSVSQEATISTSYETPIITSGLENLTVKAGNSFVFNISASNPENGPLRYRWFVDDTEISVSSNRYERLFDDLISRSIKCIVSNKYRSAETNAIITPEYGIPELNAPLQDTTLSFGQSKTFDVVASNPENDELQYAWYINGIFVSNAPTFLYEAKVSEKFTLKCIVANKYQSIESSSRVTSAYLEPEITKHITSVSMRPNDSVEFIVDAVDPQDDVLVYAWYIDGVPVGYGKSYTYTSESEIEAHTIWCKVSNKYKSVYSRATVAVTDSEALSITTLPYAYVLLYNDEMNISSESQADANGIALVPSLESTMNLGIVFGPETIIDKNALHQFFIEKVLKENRYLDCPAYNLIDSNEYYDPYLSPDDMTQFKGDDEYLNSDELYLSMLYKFDENNDAKLQLGELPDRNDETNILTYAYIYHDIKTQAYSFLKLLPESNQVVEYKISNYNKCQANSIKLIEDEYNDYNINSYNTDENNLTTIVVIRDGEEAGNILLALSDLYITNSSYVVQDFQNQQLESDKFTLADGDNTNIAATANFNGYEFVISTDGWYDWYDTIEFFLLKETDVGKRYLSFDSFVNISSDTEESYYESYLSHNYIYLDPLVTSMESIPKPHLSVDSNLTTRTISLLDNNASTALEHTFSYNKDGDSALYIYEMYTIIPNTVANYLYKSETAPHKIEKLLPGSLASKTNVLFNDFYNATIIESVNRVDYKEDNLTRVLERVQDGETIFDIGVKKLKHIFSDSRISLGLPG